MSSNEYILFQKKDESNKYLAFILHSKDEPFSSNYYATAVVVFWDGVCDTHIVVLWIVVLLLNPHIFMFKKKDIKWLKKLK